MNSKVLSVFKNDRYKILKSEKNDYYLIDTDDKKLAFLHSYFALFGNRKAYKIMEITSDDLRVSRMEVKNGDNKIFFYIFIFAVIYYIIARVMMFNLYIGYNSITFWIFHILYLVIAPLVIRICLSSKEKRQIKERVKGENLKHVTIRLKSEVPFKNQVKLFMASLFVQIGMPIIVIFGFSPLLDTPIELAIFPILINAFILMVGNRSAFTNKYTKINIEEIN